jgi:hypothetical protein
MQGDPRFNDLHDGIAFGYRPILAVAGAAPKPIRKLIRRFYARFLPPYGGVDVYVDSFDGKRYCVAFFHLP